MRILSRSSHETYNQCPRRFYWTFCYQGTGVEPRITPIHLAVGLAVHKGMEFLMKERSIEAALEGGVQEWAIASAGHPPDLVDEGRALIKALLMAWNMVRRPAFEAEWEVISVEREGRVELAPGVTLQYRPDLVARSKEDGLLYVWNWKTRGSSRSDKDFTSEWKYDVQMWTEAQAVEKEIGEPVRGVVVEGLLKGSFKWGHFFSPLIWGYRLPQGAGEWLYSYEYKRPSSASPWGKFQAWREDTYPTGGSGLEGWLSWLPLHVVAAQFVRSDVITRPPEVVDEWIDQVVRRERDIAYVLAEGTERDKLAFFWQHFSPWNCNGCPFEPVCGKRATIADLVSAGVYTKRVDHHGGYGG